jgi:hypothetical protein
MNAFQPDEFQFSDSNLTLLTARVRLEVGFSAAATAFERPTLNPPKGRLCHFPGGKSRLAIMPATKFISQSVFNSFSLLF